MLLLGHVKEAVFHRVLLNVLGIVPAYLPTAQLLSLLQWNII